MIRVADLAFRYRPDSDELFNGLTYTFQPGLLTAVTGASGRGKSTLLYVLGLMLSPSGGTVIVDGVDTRGLSDAHKSDLRARRIGFVFQDSALDPTRTLLESVIEPALYAGRTRRDAISPARVLLNRMGVEHRIDQRPGQISGGQAQRVALCRALINEPAMLLADEPTGNLDRVSAEGVISVLREASRNASVIIATHDPFVLEHVDEVLAL
ncbi:ABC transporter ATP-binding protein [Galbitalea sp. SE-J8]|uniref:ABC transporter ATP-binding protein n=1 Tax=Galbitalea sp. SE-J8 TaxID=3054952 RepID=UPI00259CBF72|nr:ABC transporter ATP-binding protein [Galbitalea sp. SE-J8]MDM4763716.1 ABC transporter ATP-binding protein [Galbitalea sp. SE-J8]